MCSVYKITNEDCITILEQHFQREDIKLLEFDEKPILTVGIMSSHSKLKTKAKIGDKIISNSFFVKRMTTKYDMQNKAIQDQGVYEKEYFVYYILRQLYEKESNYVCDFMANCYLAIKNQLFVFEDLSEEGYVTANMGQDLKLDEKHLKLVLDSAAKFHAGCIIYEHSKTNETGAQFKIVHEYSQYLTEPLFRKNEEYSGEKMYRTAVKAALALIDVAPYFTDKNEIKTKFLKYVEQVYELVKSSKIFYNVICHGDLWFNNLLFKYDENNQPIHCKILDFQAIRYTIPVHDLYVLYSNRNFDNDNEHLLEFYYNCLKKYLTKSGIDINKYITFEEYQKSVEYIYPLCVVQCVCFFNLCVGRVYNIYSNEKLFTESIYEDRSTLCVEAYKNNDFVRKIVDRALKYLNKL